MKGPRSGARCRCRVGPGRFEVRARIERFIEATLLLLLKEGSSHGYELAEQIELVLGEGRVDFGNLYRLLRSLEAEHLVQSTWNDDVSGPLKRTYEITDEGSALLDAWARSLKARQEKVSAFLERYEHLMKKEVVPTEKEQ